MDNRDQAVREALWSLRRIAAVMQKVTTPAWIELKLTMAQVKGLFILARQGSMPVGRLAEVLGIGEPSASQLIDRLVRLQLAVRTEDPEDRRRTLVSLSRQGEELVANLRHGSKTSLERWLARLSEQDLTLLRQGLQALAASAEACEGINSQPECEVSRCHQQL